MIYKAKDGKEFETEREALSHEKKLDLQEIRDNVLPKIKEHWNIEKLIVIKLSLGEHRIKLKKGDNLDEAIIDAMYYNYLPKFIYNEITMKDVILYMGDIYATNTSHLKKCLNKIEYNYLIDNFINYFENRLRSPQIFNIFYSAKLIADNYTNKHTNPRENYIALYFQIKTKFPEDICEVFLNNKRFIETHIEDMLRYNVIDVEYVKNNLEIKLINFTKYPYRVNRSNYIYSGHGDWIQIRDLKNNISYQIRKSTEYDSPYFYKQTIESVDINSPHNQFIDEVVGEQIVNIIESINIPKNITIRIDKKILINKFGEGEKHYYWHRDNYRHKLEILQVNKESFKVRFAYLGDVSWTWRDKYKDNYEFEIPKFDYWTNVDKHKDSYTCTILGIEIVRIWDLLHNTKFQK